MAKGQKISELLNVSTLSGHELIPLAINGQNESVTAEDLRRFTNAAKRYMVLVIPDEEGGISQIQYVPDDVAQEYNALSLHEYFDDVRVGDIVFAGLNEYSVSNIAVVEGRRTVTFGDGITIFLARKTDAEDISNSLEFDWIPIDYFLDEIYKLTEKVNSVEFTVKNRVPESYDCLHISDGAVTSFYFGDIASHTGKSLKVGDSLYRANNNPQFRMVITEIDLAKHQGDVSHLTAFCYDDGMIYKFSGKPWDTMNVVSKTSPYPDDVATDEDVLKAANEILNAQK